MIKEKCPKCNFYLTDNYCVKCGYTKNVFVNDNNQYNNTNDIELYLKNTYPKIVYNKNLLCIFILGPLYFSYFKFYLLGFILFTIEFMISYLINNIFGPLGFGIEPILIFYLLSRLIYVIGSNSILLKLLNKKLTALKEQDAITYQEKILPAEPCSLLSLTIGIAYAILFMSLFLVWYRIQNGTLTLF